MYLACVRKNVPPWLYSESAVQPFKNTIITAAPWPGIKWSFDKELNEAAIHYGFYEIIHLCFRSQAVTIFLIVVNNPIVINKAQPRKIELSSEDSKKIPSNMFEFNIWMVVESSDSTILRSISFIQSITSSSALPSKLTAKQLSKCHKDLSHSILELLSLVSIKKRNWGLCALKSLDTSRITQGFPKPRQFQLMILIILGKVGSDQPLLD